MEKEKAHKGNLLDEAEAWVIKLRSDDISADEKRQFSEWLNTSREHIQAFDEAYDVWENIGAVKFLPEETIEAYQNQNSRFSDNVAHTVKSLYSRFMSPWNVTIATTCLLALFFVSNAVIDPSQTPPSARFETSIGETRTLTLEDGSKVELNTHSIIDIQYTQAQRLLTLVKGEAFFSVASDKKRPFVVKFGKGSATAVGTAFNVYRQETNTAITVTEGIVAVRESADLAVPNPEAQHITQNQQVKVGSRGVGPTRNIQPDYQLTWRDKTVVFNNTSLSSALKELNRYLETPVDVKKSTLSDLHISGTFSLNSPDETLDALIAAFNLTKIASSTDNTLYLSDE